MFIIQRCKREEYIKAWNYMYKHNKEGFNSELYDGVNPSLNKKPLGTETDNFCVVAYDSSIDCSSEGFNLGYPVGIFSFVVTPAKIIGKQYVVDNRYSRKGIGRALLLECEKCLIENGFDWYYIGCSHCSAGIYKKYLGIEPYSSDEEHDMFKFNVRLDRESFNKQYNDSVENNPIFKVVDLEGNIIIDFENTNKNTENKIKTNKKKKNKKKKR